MTDIVERLRDPAHCARDEEKMFDAADEIERLHHIEHLLQIECQTLRYEKEEEIERLEAEIKRLNEILRMHGIQHDVLYPAITK